MNRPAHLARLADHDDDPFVHQPNDRYFNRELSWLAFNRRVLDEARNLAHPLLERLRFLSISGSNLDEFFMVRVAGLKGQQLQDVENRSADGLTAGQQLVAITAAADDLMHDQQLLWAELRVLLDEAGVHVLRRDEIDEEASAWLETYFREQLFPVLTPQALDPAHPFPFIPNRGLSLIFDLVRLSDKEPVREVVMLPATMPRYIRVPGDVARYVAIESIVKRFASVLFPGYRIDGAGAFRVLRDSDLEIEEEAEDLVRYFANAIKRRRRGRVIRLELETNLPDTLAAALKDELGEADAIITESGDLLGIADLERRRRRGSAGPQIPALFAALPRTNPRIRRRLLRRDPCEGHRRPPPVRDVRGGDRLSPPGGGGSRRRRDQADIVPRGQAVGGHQRADRRRRSRQVGHRRRRAEGALRRGTEHALGLRAGTRRRAGRLRLHRLEDARQGIDGGAPGKRGV